MIIRTFANCNNTKQIVLKLLSMVNSVKLPGLIAYIILLPEGLSLEGFDSLKKVIL